MKKPTVLIVDDHAIVRSGIRSLLETAGSVDVIGEAQNGRQALDMVRKLHPAVVLMDIAMPVLNGLEATRRILKSFPSTRVLMLSGYDDDAYVDQVIELGASGYLVKQSSANVLSQAILEADKGNTYYSAAVATRLDDRKRTAPERAERPTKAAGKAVRKEAAKRRLHAHAKADACSFEKGVEVNSGG